MAIRRQPSSSPWVGVACAAAIVFAAFGSAADGQRFDPLEPLLDYRPPLASVVTDRHGRVIGQFFAERRRLVAWDEIPEHVIQAFVASEDGRFFEHSGIDVTAILRAAWTNLRGGRIEQGASTITQQTVKNVLLTPERSWSRKLREVALALEVERRLSKREILLIYLNHVYLGNGSYGLLDAARSYFGKEVHELSVSEAALLAGLPQRPSAYSPVDHPEAAEARRRYVLGRMLDRGFLTQEVHRLALADAPVIQPGPEGAAAPDFAKSFVEEVRRELVDRLGAMRLYREGLTVETTLDLELQRAADAALRGGLEDVDRRQGWRGPERTVPPEALAAARVEIGSDNRWHPGMSAVDLDGERAPVRGVVLAARTDADGREQLHVGLAPDLALPAEIDPAAWGVVPAPPGDETRMLHVGDVARFRIVASGAAPVAVLYQEPGVEGALVSLDVDSGDVLALVGGYDFARSEFNRAVQARRQPGSALKPFVYAAAIEAGYTQASFVLDAPNVFWDRGSGSVWRPRNYGRRFLGWLTLRRALAQSVNNATISLARRVGVARVVEMAERLGVGTDLPPNLSLALGSGETTLLDLTRAYAAFPAGGTRVEPRLIRSVRDRDGNVLYAGEAPGASAAPGRPDAAAAPERVLSAPVARVMTDLLQGAIFEPGATGRRARDLDAAVAGKTGTTNGNRDAWFVGFSPDVATGVWVGFDRPSSLGRGETGGRAALPIWVDYMRAVLASRPARDFATPEGIVFARVDARTGRRVADAASPRASWQVFVDGTEPGVVASRRREVRTARRELMQDVF